MNLDPINNDKNTTKKGFKNSTGWNLGKMGKSNHLFEPFISTPKIGVSNSEIKKKINNKIAILYTYFSLMAEKIKIKDKPKIIYRECLKKK